MDGARSRTESSRIAAASVSLPQSTSPRLGQPKAEPGAPGRTWGTRRSRGTQVALYPGTTSQAAEKLGGRTIRVRARLQSCRKASLEVIEPALAGDTETSGAPFQPGTPFRHRLPGWGFSLTSRETFPVSSRAQSRDLQFALYQGTASQAAEKRGFWVELAFRPACVPLKYAGLQPLRYFELGRQRLLVAGAAALVYRRRPSARLKPGPDTKLG